MFQFVRLEYTNSLFNRIWLPCGPVFGELIQPQFGDTLTSEPNVVIRFGLPEMMPLKEQVGIPCANAGVQ